MRDFSDQPPHVPEPTHTPERDQAQRFAQDASPFAPNRGSDGPQRGLQRNPAAQKAPVEPNPEPTFPWRDENTGVIAGSAAVAVPEEKPEAHPTVPKIDVRMALFGRIIPWRTIAGVSAAVLAVAGIGGFVGGFAGKTFRADYERVELSLNPPPDDAQSLTAIGEVAAKVMPAVVSISVQAGEISGVGSGFVIDPEGYILTNNHVVSTVADRPDAQITVTLTGKDSDGRDVMRKVPAQLVGRDRETDLAVVQVHNVDGLTVATLGDSARVNIGDTVIAMGSPQGLGGTVTTGIISALNRPIRLQAEGTDTDGFADALQTDASINPGNSGGPLVDMRGGIIGINTVIFTVSGGSQGLGFAIPINFAATIAEQLIAGETPVHPSIGVTARTVDNGNYVGAEIASVRSGSPAASAGLKEGDVITAVGKRNVGSADELTVALWTSGAGQETTLTVVRGGEPVEVPITPQ